MRTKLLLRTSVAAIVPLAALFGAERAANAVTNCSSLLTATNVIVIESGDTQENLLKQLGYKLQHSTAFPTQVLYNTTGSCTLISDMYTGNKLAVDLKYIPSDADTPNWTPSLASPVCKNDVTGGIAIDLAISALFTASCPGGATPPSGLGLINGPIQAYTLVVPKAATQKSIWAEEAYFVFGFGSAGMVTPWTNDQEIFIRTPAKSTQLTIAANIGVPATKWKGVTFDKSTDLLNAVANAAAPDSAIGILGAEVYDAQRDKLNVLAFKAFGQHHGWFPDSTATSFDKKNLRDGHYVPWSPTVYVAAVDNNNVPTKPTVKYFVDLVLGNDTTPKFESPGIDSVVKVGLIPDCAMKVSRQADGGDLSLYTPAHPCQCFYEANVPQGAAPASCKTCTTNSDCSAPTPSCNHGFCEVQ